MFNVGLEFWIWEVLSGIWNVEIVWHGNCSVENGFCNWSCFGFLAPVSVLEFFSCCCYGSWTIKFLSQEAWRWGDWPCFGADQATKPGDPGIDTSCQCPIATFTTSKYTSSSTYSRCPSKFSWPSRCFSNAPSNAPSKYPSACHLAFYKLLENISWMKEWSTQAGVFCDCGFESISCQPCTVQYVHHHASWSGPAVTPYSPTSPIDAGEQAEKSKEDEDSNVDWVNWASLEKWLEIMGSSDSLRRCQISMIN